MYAADRNLNGDNITNVGSITATGSITAANEKFSVNAKSDNISAELKLGYLTISATNDGITFIDTNRQKLDGSYTDTITIGRMKEVSDYTQGIRRSSEKDRDDTTRNYTTIESQVKIRNDGRVEIGSSNTQSVLIDGGYGILVGHQGKVISEKDGDVYLPDKTAGLSNVGVFAGGNQFANAKAGMSNADGSLKAASGKFKVNADGSINANDKFVVDDKGAITAAGSKFYVKQDGKVQIEDELVISHDNGNGTGKSATLNIDKLTAINKLIKVTDGVDPTVVYDTNRKPVITAGSGSTIGGVTIDGESLSNGTKSIKVSELKDDHDLVNDATKGNEKLHNDLVDVQDKARGLSDKTSGIKRDTTGTAATTIEGKLKVSSDGTVKINEGEDQQVIIDSNGIKVGKNSARMNDSYGFATTRDLYIGADSADAPTEAGSKFYVKGSDGSIKAANGKFNVDNMGSVVTSGSISLKNGGKTTTIAGDTVTVSSSGVSKSFNLSDIADVGQNMTNLGNRIDDVNTRVDGVAQDVTNLSNRVGTVESSINDVKNSVDSVKQDVTNLGNRVGNVETSINDVKQDVTSLGNRVGNVETSITDVKQDVTSLGNRVDNVETSITDVKNRVDNISTDFDNRLNTAIADEAAARQADVADLNSRIDTVNTNLGDLDKLDGDLKVRDEYTSNSSVVGGINAEAAVRKEEVSRLDTAIADEAAARQADVARLDGRISDVSSRVNKVGAMAAAISSLKTMGYDPESPTEFSVGLGQYKGETGVALGFFHYPNKNFMINVSLSTSSGEIMGGIGATWRFGHKSPQKLLEEQREAQVKKEFAAAEAYKAARAAKQTK